MYLFGSLQRSTRNSSVSQIRGGPILEFLYPGVPVMGAGNTTSSRSRRRDMSRVVADREDVNALLIKALVRAGSCRKHNKHEAIRSCGTSQSRWNCHRTQGLFTCTKSSTKRTFSTTGRHLDTPATVPAQDIQKSGDFEAAIDTLIGPRNCHGGANALKTQHGPSTKRSKPSTARSVDEIPAPSAPPTSSTPAQSTSHSIPVSKAGFKLRRSAASIAEQRPPEHSSLKNDALEKISIGDATGMTRVDSLAIEVADRYPRERTWRESWQVATYCKTYVPGFKEADQRSKRIFVNCVQYWIDKAKSFEAASLTDYHLSKDELYALLEDAPGFEKWLKRLRWRESQDLQDIEVANEERISHDILQPLTPTEDTEQTVRIIQDLIRWYKTPPNVVYNLYSSLPEPRPLQLGKVTAYDLLSFFNLVHRSDPASSERYFTLLDEYRACGVEIGTRHWNWAIRIAGQSGNHAEDNDVETSLCLWREMERQGHASNEITFNVLSQVALKAKNFDTVMMIRKEMKRRQIRNSRYFDVGLISYYGVVGDCQGIRHAYKKMVSQGSVIDTLVLNAVITALIAANDPVAAEQVFHRMKDLQSAKQQSTMLYRHTVKWKWEGWHLSAIEGNPRHRWRLALAHKHALVGPDIATYRLLLGYHARLTGNLDRVTELLQELTSAGATSDGHIFMSLFDGFKRHGALPYSAWTEARLDKVFVALCTALDAALDADVNPARMTVGLVTTILRAYAKCTTRERVLDVWHELDIRWTHPHPQEREAALDRLSVLLNEPSTPSSGHFASA
ncbi:hypothetical protein EJ05DRAFT_474875 [Pseudovirgaria hyperparasitica]|uniref:Pentacotripeptide-repeat region of PRORP domain-containing protein n=1 Tax=Pseudovirgaria hyperparasitica TaxID=470096 RepID=A0A6A6WCB3_9PEZI|nr:uncharacterized protein EJ05DRAFT_474875 [Pseudovirgaria hyperparasitica]KAF2759819.1 hypothetical protein EJ05DRAFT_474875 [Pseudovirgaria hyperparasitica]